MTQQTAVEWLVGELSKYDIHKPMSMADWSVLKELSEQAKQMEKEQILNAFTDGDYQAFESEAEQYYNETYENK